MLSLSLFMTTEYSKFIWDRVQLLSFLQFPWRFLTFAGLFISVAGGYAVSFSLYWFESPGQRKWMAWAIGVVIICATIFQYQKYFKPSGYLQTNDKSLTSVNEIAWNVSSATYDFVPKGVPLKKSKYDTSIFDINESDIRYKIYDAREKDIKVILTSNDFNRKSFSVEAKKPTTFQLNTFNFPGWIAYIDGGRLPISDNNKYRLINVEVPSSVHNLEFRFEDTPIRKWSNGISLATLLTAVLLLGVGKFKKSKA